MDSLLIFILLVGHILNSFERTKILLKIYGQQQTILMTGKSAENNNMDIIVIVSLYYVLFIYIMYYVLHGVC